MEGVRLELSARGVGEASVFEDREFVFVVGGVEYECCRFQACFVSGRVRRLLHGDRCLSRLCLKVSDENGYFEDIVSLMNGESITVTSENSSFLEACARELENDELLGRLVGFKLEQDEISMSNVVDRVSLKSSFHSDYSSEIEFVASHFFEIGNDVLNSLSIGDLELVLENPRLKLESEDQLYEAICSRIDTKGEENLGLLRHVQFTVLSDSKLREFLDRVFPDLVNGCFWESLCDCVVRYCGSHAKEPLMKVDRYVFEEFGRGQDVFSGILQHLRTECGGNPHHNDVISITASSNNWNHCYQLVDYGWNNWWNSKNEPNSFVQFDFKSSLVSLTGYTLKSDGYNGNHLVSWALEVSDDGSTWDAIDERTNTQDLNGNYIVKTYDCNKRSDRFTRFVRLRQTGWNSNGSNYLMLSEIEFFGKLRK